ncbi:MAG: ISNCY family transposase [Ignavibacteriaceae bacterium]
MSNKAKQEYLKEIKPRYKKADKTEKSRILTEFCKTCGYNRKYAICLLNQKDEKKTSAKKRPGRKPNYNNPVIIHFLKAMLKSTNMICSKRLKQIIPLWMPFYESSYCIRIPEPIRQKLLRISPSSIDRLLRKERKKLGKLGLSTTKPGSLIKKHVPIKTNQWDETRPGFLEADTVAHCGSSVAGAFVYTVNMVDIATGWTEARAIWGKGEKTTFEAIESIEKALPFKILGFDSDNGGEFLNWHLYKYFTNRKLPVEYTRSRSYQKNDNAHVEGKNWTHIRQYLGYQRFDDPRIVQMLNQIYTNYWSLFFNFFIPSSKIISKQRIGSKIIKKHDKPKTPVDRLLESYDIPISKKNKLLALRKTLNPFTLQAAIQSEIIQILKLTH